MIIWPKAATQSLSGKSLPNRNPNQNPNRNPNQNRNLNQSLNQNRSRFLKMTLRMSCQSYTACQRMPAKGQWPK